MTAGRPASLVATCDQWVRASHSDTAVDGADGVVMLSWREPDPVAPPDGSTCLARGLATDRLCRIYRLTGDRVERLAVGSTARGLDYGRLPAPVVLIGPPGAGASGGTDGGGGAPVSGPEFTRRERPPIGDGAGIAIDRDDRLFLADREAGTISVLDLWSRRLLRTVSVASPGQPGRRPGGMTAGPDGQVWAVVADSPGLLRLSATRGPVEHPLPAGAAALPPEAHPTRVAVLLDGTPVVLLTSPDGSGWLVSGNRPPRPVGPTSDIVVDHDGALVVAPCPSPDGSATLRRFTPTPDGWNRAAPLDASGYDGNGLVVTEEGRIGYFSAAGFRLAVIGRVRYRTEGRVVTYRLDSGTALNRWGRLFIEACLPEGTDCRVATITSDDPFATEMPHVAAEPAHCDPADPADTPALPPASLVPAAADVTGRFHRRDSSTAPWWPTDDRYQIHEAPVTAPPGRYLWVVLRLTGNQRRSPRIRELRVEHQAHTLLRRLPAVYRHDDRQADFLHRYLAPLDGMLHDLEVAARCRSVLVDPHGTPAEALGWLASFFGLVLDTRWAEAAKRQLIAEIVPLYRRRGTPWALARYIELYLAGDRAGDPGAAITAPIIVEHFRLRGLGGPLLGADPTVSSRSVLGHGFRVGGGVGTLERAPLDPDADADTSFASNAHRFTVLIPRLLGAEDDAVVRHILDRERPAHTAYELCTIDAGMRVGVGLHLGLSSIVGPTGAFEGAVTGLSLLGRGALLGGPTTGITVEAGRLGHDTRVG